MLDLQKNSKDNREFLCISYVASLIADVFHYHAWYICQNKETSIGTLLY